MDGSPAAPAASAPRIFVSYNRQDVAFTRRLVTTLEAAGAIVWVDWEGARDGDFLKRINQGLVRCDWLALVETPNSLKSDPVEMEVDAALNRVLYGQMRGVLRLVAAARDPRSVPPVWATLQYYDATSDYEGAVAALLAAIRAGDQRQARRPGAEHPSAHGVAAPTPPPLSAPTTDAGLLLARMAALSGGADWQRVVDVADLLLAEYPTEVTTDFYRLYGRALLELGRPSGAATALRQAYDRDKMDIPTMRAAARAMLQADDLAGAEPLLKRAATLDEDDEDLLDILREYVPTLQTLAERDSATRMERLTEALSRTEQALRLRPDDPAWLTTRRDLLAALGRREEALAAARALTARPDATPADWLALARLLRLRATPDALIEATATLTATDRFAPDPAQTPGLAEERDALLAALAAQRARDQQASQWDAALRLLRLELRLAPMDRMRRLAEAEVLQRLGSNADALAAVRALLAGQYGAPTPDEALRLARLCAALGQPGEGWQALTQAGLLDAQRAGAAYSDALTVAAQLAALSGQPAQARLSVARSLLAAQRPRDAWNLLNNPFATPAEREQLAQARAELFPPPAVPARLASLGYRGVNAGAQAITPPLVAVAAGAFLMGSDKTKDSQANDNELPQHRVEVAAFQLGKYPVTVAEYALAVQAGAVREPPASGNVTWQTQRQHPDHPVVCVSWDDAQAYLAWLREATGEPGWRLPSEAEWEKAARWDARANVSRLYPWGDAFDKARCTTDESGIGTTTPVGSYPASDARRSGASPWGAEDLSGNVWEWTSSVYKPYLYTLSDGREAPDYTESRTLCGGSWYDGARYARAAFRFSIRPGSRGYGGFRLALARLPAGS